MGVKLSPKELRSQLEALIKSREPDLVALCTDREYEEPTVECSGGRVFQVRRARTVLEFYDIVDQKSDQPLLCLTQLVDGDIGLDLRARLYKRMILASDPWQTVKHLFDCRELEASLVEQPHLARYLMLHRPAQGYGKVKGEVLTAQKVWSCLFAHCLAMPADYLDNLSLLQWAAGDCSAYLTAPADLKESASERVRHVCGEYGRALLATVEDKRLQPLALGLALRCLVESAPQFTAQQREAFVRLESYTGGKPLDADVALEWAGAAEHLYLSDPQAYAGLAREADRILDLLHARPVSFLSDFLPNGLTARRETLAMSLSAALTGQAGEQEVEGSAQSCVTHRESGESEKLCYQMLPRLLRWLQSPRNTKKLPPAKLARRYAWNTAFADWARLRCEGQGKGAVEGPLASLLDRVVARLEDEAEEFALGLQAWNSAGEPSSDLLWGVEDLVDRALVPIARSKGGRFLLVVLDGCAWPTLHELLDSFAQSSWKRLEPVTGLPAMLATYPSVTEFSRTSLFSGRLVSGNASVEAKNFSEHPALREACTQGRPPCLFHKADLNSGYESLSGEVEARICDTKYKAVAVVLNAIDDHLEKNDQLDFPWTVSHISYLADLASLAHRSGRILVLASDHGHVLERGSELTNVGEVGGARWRPGKVASKGEIQLSGPRAVEHGSVVLPWSEKIRYTKKKAGYHGGCHPREILAPLLVLAPADLSLTGWREAVHSKPTWWDVARPRPRKVTPPPPPEVFVEEETPHTETDQFLLPSIEEPKTFADVIVDFPAIVDRWKQPGIEVDKDWAHRLLTELETLGDQASLGVLASSFGLAEDRFRYLLIRAANILSVDGRYVVTLTPDAQTVLLHRDALGGFSSPSKDGTQIEVERVTGDTLSFTVPVKSLDTKERIVLEALARHGQLTEAEVKKLLQTRRGGFMEKLVEKLARAGFSALKQTGHSDGGRVYRLEIGEL